MKIAFNQQGNARKQMISIIAKVVHEEHSYSGVPRCEYRVGGFTIDRDGTLIFDSATIDVEQLRTVLDALNAGGFNYEGSDCLEIGYPREGFTEEGIQNLRLMIQAKESLIKKALGVDELPIEVGGTEITFPWFRTGLTAEETYALAQFITQLCKTAKSRKRVMAETKAVDNEKFRMRIFCISLGMVGSEFKLARKLLGANLSGNSAWSNGVDPRRKAPAETEAADETTVPETSPDEAQAPDTEA